MKDLFGCSAALSRALNLGEREAVAHTKLEGAQRLYDALKAQGGQVEEPGAPEPEVPQRTMEETAALLGTAQADLERTGRALSMALGRQKAVGDPAALAARQEELEGELERRSQEYQAISTALTALKEANAQLQERFSPELNRRAGEYLARLTGEKYTSLSLNRELEASAAGAGDVDTTFEHRPERVLPKGRRPAPLQAQTRKRNRRRLLPLNPGGTAGFGKFFLSRIPAPELCWGRFLFAPAERSTLW